MQVIKIRGPLDGSACKSAAASVGFAHLWLSGGGTFFLKKKTLSFRLFSSPSPSSVRLKKKNRVFFLCVCLKRDSLLSYIARGSAYTGSSVLQIRADGAVRPSLRSSACPQICCSRAWAVTRYSSCLNSDCELCELPDLLSKLEFSKHLSLLLYREKRTTTTALKYSQTTSQV